MPDITSYDYDCPVTEQGRPASKYTALRELIARKVPQAVALPAVPALIPVRAIPEIKLTRWRRTLGENLQKPVTLAQPKPFEMLGQTTSLMLYQQQLAETTRCNAGHAPEELNDYGLVFLRMENSLRHRRRHRLQQTPSNCREPTPSACTRNPGRSDEDIEIRKTMIDRKGITDRATLNGMTLMNWEVFGFPLDERWVTSLHSSPAAADRPGGFFKGNFELDEVADTFLDLSNYQKGYVWLNGHNLGRYYWNIGPQQRLSCPASWLKRGTNEIIVLDFASVRTTRPIARQGKATD